MKIKTEERREREATRVTEKSREIRQAGEIYYYLFMNVEYCDARQCLHRISVLKLCFNTMC